MKILIIEDDDGIRQTLQCMLDLNGYEVALAKNGAEGVALAAQRPDLIFCDIGLPGMDGYAVIEKIQAIPECGDIPFVFLTARADRNDQRRGMALGADDYITKPFSERDILEAIAVRTQRRETLRARVEEVVNGERLREAGADWSHELMTPLAGVMGGLELIEREADTIQPAELRELLGIIRAGAERQERLSRKLIQYFEIERRRVAHEGFGSSVTTVEHAIMAGAAKAAHVNDREKDLELNCSAAVVACEEAYLVDAIFEVVDNAFRFSKKGDRVVVSGVTSADRYLIEVIDVGIGMTEEERRSIGAFTQFGRDKHEQQGLGLGLAIAKTVVDIAKGSFRIEAGPGGRGVAVRIELACV